jgi:hypothetical protein
MWEAKPSVGDLVAVATGSGNNDAKIVVVCFTKRA